MAAQTLAPPVTFWIVLARVVMIATGAWTAYIGYTILTTPAAIPLTVVLWLIAAAIVALGARGKIDRGWGGFDASHLD